MRAANMTPAARDAVVILGQLIHQARVERGWTLAHTASLLGITRATMTAIEAGAPGTSVGTVLNAASILGVPLFGTEDPAELARLRREGAHRDALLPTRVRPARVEIDVDF